MGGTVGDPARDDGPGDEAGTRCKIKAVWNHHTYPYDRWTSLQMVVRLPSWEAVGYWLFTGGSSLERTGRLAGTKNLDSLIVEEYPTPSGEPQRGGGYPKTFSLLA